MRCIEARGRYKELRSGGREVDGGMGAPTPVNKDEKRGGDQRPKVSF